MFSRIDIKGKAFSYAGTIATIGCIGLIFGVPGEIFIIPVAVLLWIDMYYSSRRSKESAGQAGETPVVDRDPYAADERSS